MLIHAHGKINLSLDITGKRDDGYHDIASLMQSVELCDEVEITVNDSGNISVETDCPTLENGESNIAYKACSRMKRDYNLSCGFDIFIKKRIPLAGGMAGGSTDAAAVIRGINELCSLHLTNEEMMTTGLKIGADVPFCIQENPALATGIGEILTPVAGLPENIWIVLVNPGVAVSTKQIYEAIDTTQTYGIVDNKALVAALQNKDIQVAKKHMVNVMESVTEILCPQVSSIIEALKGHGAIHAMMSGSGATCFGIYTSKPDEEKIRNIFPGYYVAMTKPYTNTF